MVGAFEFATTASGLRGLSRTPIPSSLIRGRPTASTLLGRSPLNFAQAARWSRSAPRQLSAVVAVAAAVAAPPAPPPETLSTQRLDDVALVMTVVKEPATDTYSVRVTTTDGGARPNMVMHWAENDWELPPHEHRPAGTVQAGDLAVQTPFGPSGEVVLTFPSEGCPAKIVFVLKDGEKWSNSGGGDFVAFLKPPGVEEIVAKVLEAESEYERWSLFSRFQLASSMLSAATAAGPPGMALMLVWLRLSAQRQLPWYKGTNYQSKDAAHAQKTLAQRMADTVGGPLDPLSRALARASMAGLPRGGGNGDDIRHGILNVMRENGIREGHRPGIQDDFLESWHQKLHTNTTPEDVTICEAYLAFLRSGDMGEFWRVAWERGNLTAEMLAAMDHPVTPTPCHLPHLIGPMEHYLWILKSTHSGADLDIAFEMARGRLDGDLAWNIGDVLANRNEWWVPGKIVEVRRRLASYWKCVGAPRDILLLDIALDSYFRLCVERTDKGSMSDDDVFNLAGLVLDNAAVTGESDELAAAAALWGRVGAAEGRWHSREWGALALAAADNASLCLEGYADSIVELVQPLADKFGAKCGIDPAYILNFGEEVVRSQPAFILSPLLLRLGPALRGAAGVGAWQVVSQGPGAVAGTMTVMPDLEAIQGKPPASPVVIIADKLSGNEDIPDNVVAILTGSATDVLSHVAIRARAQSVLLASCFDPEQLESMRSMAGTSVEVGVTPAGDVLAEAASGAAGAAEGAKGGAASKGLKLGTPKGLKGGKSAGAWCVRETEFSAGQVGSKGLNLAALRGKLPADVGMPSSIALPFGTFERVLADPANAAVAAAVKAAEAELKATPDGSGVPPTLHTLRDTVRTQLVPPAALVAEAAAAAAAAGLIEDVAEWEATGAGWAQTWAAVCRVWASKWNDRAWLSRRAQKVPDADLFMSVLLQGVLPAKYAFVLHTADPLTGALGQLHGELVQGMGEALVGNYPGRALSFSSSGPGSVEIGAFPSKRNALYADSFPLLIARSDSNGEDLEEFAGAGLYSSVPLSPLRVAAACYADEPLMWDVGARQELLGRLAAVGAAVETVCGSPQDVEGVVGPDGHISVVQARPQVL